MTTPKVSYDLVPTSPPRVFPSTSFSPTFFLFLIIYTFNEVSSTNKTVIYFTCAHDDLIHVHIVKHIVNSHDRVNQHIHHLTYLLFFLLVRTL